MKSQSQPPHFSTGYVTLNIDPREYNIMYKNKTKRSEERVYGNGEMVGGDNINMMQTTVEKCCYGLLYLLCAHLIHVKPLQTLGYGLERIRSHPTD